MLDLVDRSARLRETAARLELLGVPDADAFEARLQSGYRNFVQRFADVAARIPIRGAAEVLSELADPYLADSRAYHLVHHPAEVVGSLHILTAPLDLHPEDRAVLDLAALGHDLDYEVDAFGVPRGDNEANSARRVRELLDERVPSAMLEDVCGLIELSAHEADPNLVLERLGERSPSDTRRLHGLSRLLNDADLAGLATTHFRQDVALVMMERRLRDPTRIQEELHKFASWLLSRPGGVYLTEEANRLWGAAAEPALRQCVPEMGRRADIGHT